MKAKLMRNPNFYEIYAKTITNNSNEILVNCGDLSGEKNTHVVDLEKC